MRVLQPDGLASRPTTWPRPLTQCTGIQHARLSGCMANHLEAARTQGQPHQLAANPHATGVASSKGPSRSPSVSAGGDAAAAASMRREQGLLCVEQHVGLAVAHVLLGHWQGEGAGPQKRRLSSAWEACGGWSACRLGIEAAQSRRPQGTGQQHAEVTQCPVPPHPPRPRHRRIGTTSHPSSARRPRSAHPAATTWGMELLLCACVQCPQGLCPLRPQAPSMGHSGGPRNSQPGTTLVDPDRTASRGRSWLGPETASRRGDPGGPIQNGWSGRTLVGP